MYRVLSRFTITFHGKAEEFVDWEMFQTFDEALRRYRESTKRGGAHYVELSRAYGYGERDNLPLSITRKI